MDTLAMATQRTARIHKTRAVPASRNGRAPLLLGIAELQEQLWSLGKRERDHARALQLLSIAKCAGQRTYHQKVSQRYSMPRAAESCRAQYRSLPQSCYTHRPRPLHPKILQATYDSASFSLSPIDGSPRRNGCRPILLLALISRAAHRV